MAVDVLPVAGAAIHTKWKEQFASSSLNKRPVGVVAPGIYRGLILETDPLLGDRTIVVATDPTKGDHVAVYETSDGFSVNYRDAASGDFTLDLSSFVSVTVVVTLFVDYAVGVDTSGAFRVFTVAEYDALATDVRDELVVLGTVVVPASGAIAGGSITLDRRTLASANIQQGTIQQSPIIRNGNFELSEDTATYGDSSAFWEKSITAGTGVWRTVSTDSNSGLKSVQLEMTATPVTGRLTQQLGTAMAEGTVITVEAAVKQLRTVTGGDFRLFLEWGAADGSILSTTNVNLDGGGIDASFREVSTFVAAPAGTFSLRSAGIEVSAVVPSSVGSFARIDDVNLFIEPADPKFPYPFFDQNRSQIGTTAVVVNDADAGALSSKAATLRYDSTSPASEGKLRLEGRDSADLPPALEVMGRVLGLGEGLIGSAADAIKSRVSATQAPGGTSEYTAMWESLAGGTQGARLYVKADGSWALTVNARWSGTDWSKDVNGTEAVVARLNGSSLVVEATNTATNTWLDNAWTNTLFTTGSVAIGSSKFTDQDLEVVDGNLEVTAGDVNVVAGDLDVQTGTGHITGVLTVDDDIDARQSILLGADLLSADTDAETARIKVDRALDATSARTLIAEFVGSSISSPQNTRLYATGVSNESFEITVNAKWDDSAGQWVKDNVSQNSMQYSFNRNLMQVSHRSTTDNWDDTNSASGWDNGVWAINLSGASTMTLGNATNASLATITAIDGKLDFSSVGTQSNPSMTLDITNSLRALNTPHMWCYIDAPSEGTATLTDGFNVDSVSNNGGDVQVNIGSSVGNTNYAIVFEDSVSGSGGVSSVSNASFVTTYTYNPPEFNGYKLWIIVMGRT